ncbi:hypothetical protein [Paraburkholderia caffeinilytica]|uniref:hypothetical protein n=1 Tax=Paraburkholderia caffeinilytica TaxID=1761016 RepID=UPI003DA0CB93
MRFCIPLGNVTSVIVGARTPEQLRDNLYAAQLSLDAAELGRLDAAGRPAPQCPGWMVDYGTAQRVPQPFVAKARVGLGGRSDSYPLAGDSPPASAHHTGWTSVGVGMPISLYFREVLALAFIDHTEATPGSQVEIVWGSPGTPQTTIRATGARGPYKQDNHLNPSEPQDIPR